MLLAVLLCMAVISAASCDADDRPFEPEVTEGFEFEGVCLIIDGEHFLIPDETYREKYGYDYLRLEIPPWVDGVSLDGIADGDRVIVRGATVAELDPPILDVDGVDFVSHGSAGDADADALDGLMAALARLGE